jgi:hypothetical protein
VSEVRAICNLSDEDFETRRAQLRRDLFSQVRGRRELPDGLVLRFDATPEMRDELEDLVRFERECCPTLGLRLQSDPQSLQLEIQGIDPRSAEFASIGQLETDGEWVPTGGARAWLALVRSAGLGALGAFLVCCVVPVGLVAVLGIALPLAAFESPWVLGPGAVAISILFWRWERRREAARANAQGCGC